MDILEIKPTKSSPHIYFDSHKNILEIKGCSYPGNSEEFYLPVFSWLTTYLGQLGNEQVNVNIELTYFNSSSSKILMEFFETLEEAVNNGKNIIVNWFYEADDEDLMEFGEEFQYDLDTLPFNLVEKEI